MTVYGNPMPLLSATFAGLDDTAPCGFESVPEVSADSLLNALEDVLWSISAEDGRLLFVSRSADAVLGHPAAGFLADPGLWTGLVHPEDVERVTAFGRERIVTEPRELEYRIVRPDGRIAWLRERFHPVRNGDGNLVRIDGLATDITAVKEREFELLRLNRLHAALNDIASAFSRLHDRETLYDTVCRILVQRAGFVAAWIGTFESDSPGIAPAAQIFGDEAAAPSFLPPLGLACADDLPLVRGIREGAPFFCGDIAAMPDLAAWCREAPEWRALASLPLRAENDVKGCLALAAGEAGRFSPEETALLSELAHDIAQAVVHIENEEWLNYRVMYDSLTGLANRTLFLDRLSQLIHRRTPFAVLVFDVDRFKYINESLTYQAGDFLLQQLGTRLVELAPDSDLARPGGDDFALVLADTYTEFEIARFVHEKLLPATSRPVAYDGEELRVTLKIGAAVFPADGGDAPTLLGNAEKAHRGAQNSNETMLFFGESMNRGMGDFLRMESRLRRAVERQEFVAYYQPKIDLRLGRMYGVEALLRWNDPDDGLILPNCFIRVLEETGVILEVGRWMLEEAGRQYLRWAEKDPSPPHIAVNISPQHLSQRNFIADVEAAVDICRDHPGFLELEITESSIMYDVEENIRKLYAVREMGVEISMDDFGTGYSSLSYLTRLPLTRLKIDQSFIIGMTESADNLAIVSSIISLAHTLDMKVAAEGVETEEQLKFLKLLRCDEIQGYLFGAPVEADATMQFKHRTW